MPATRTRQTWFTVDCPTCGAHAGEQCSTRNDRYAERPHAARVTASAPRPTPEQQAERARSLAKHQAEWASSVRTRFILSCGCEEPVSEPIPLNEWPVTTPGAVTVCDKHGEYAVVVEVRTRLIADVATLHRLYTAAGMDEYEADYLAEDQADEAGVPA